MILIIKGPETYLSQKRIKEILKKAEEEKREIKFFDLKEENHFLSIKREFFNIGFFNQKKLFILENASLNKKFQEDFQKEIERFASSPNLIVFYEKEEENGSLSKIIEKKARKEYYDFLTQKETEKWLSKMEKEKNFVFEKGAKEKLIELLGNNLWLIEKEIEKLLTFKEKKISLSDIKKLVSPQLTINIFNTLEMLVKKNKKEAILMIKKHLEGNDPPQYLFSMFAYQLREMLIVKNLFEKTRSFSFLQKKLKKPYFLIQKTLNCLRFFKKGELENLYQKLYLLDLKIRQGEISPELALFFFINSI